MILWVDDNQELRRAVAEQLEAAGHSVVDAGSAEEAMELADGDESPVELLLTDLRLPGRDGLELAEALRARVPDLPVLLVTSHASAEELRDWSDEPRFAVLQKPFDFAALHDAVSAFLAGETPRTGFGPASDPESSAASAAPQVESSPDVAPSSFARSDPELSGPPWLRAALAAGLSVFVLAVAWPWLGPAGTAPSTAPDLPDAPTEDVRRGGMIHDLEPFGPVAGVPDAFAWRPVESAASYRLQVDDVAGKILWRGQTDAAALDLPAELARKLLPLAAYYWRVEALDASGGVVAASDSVRFRIVQTDSDPTGPESDPDPEPDPYPRSSP